MAKVKHSVSPAHIQKFLAGIDYPVSKKQLIEHAKAHKADNDVITVLKAMPEREFNSPTDVSKAIGEVE
ncbi:hypothetical protein ASZ90_009660 [hydrocarbon metagenome]|uniref:DUF2795 domain-containing protein n=1 Tax=hydrocarbon metagenome TaxID=938273 RepID=A0A0W8FI85_9ZZZZ|nr:DUF2795 domain-containing protein [Methanomicrobiaceae archaeon]